MLQNDIHEETSRQPIKPAMHTALRISHPLALPPQVPENQLQQDILTAEVQEGPEETQRDHAELEDGGGMESP